MNKVNIYLPDVVGKGYKAFWDFNGRYRVCKGSRASKKSKTTALNLIYRLMKYPQANLLVIRKVFGTLKDSCYTELKWAIHRLNVDSLFDCKLSPLEITYKHDILKRKRTVIGEDGELTEVTNIPNARLVNNQYGKMVDKRLITYWASRLL